MGETAQRHPPDALVGAWRLVSWHNTAADGERTEPMGPQPLGYLLYAADGGFSVTISRRDREPFPVGDLLGGSVADRSRAVEGFVAYAGRYEFLGDRVIHHVDLSLFPNWVGTDQVRRVELSGDALELSAGPLLLGGKQQVATLVWQRASSS